MKFFNNKSLKVSLVALAVAALTVAGSQTFWLDASSHREAPMIANDPLADNTDVYAFRSPEDPNVITLIANYVPLAQSDGGPNYYQFGENVRYEIHVKNNPTTPGDDIVYRFTFKKVNEDPTTFFNIRLGKQNLRTFATAEKSTDGGKTFTTVLSNARMAPTNIGPRSIEGPVGLNKPYAELVRNGVHKATSGETMSFGPVEDPFFVDLGGIFDLANIRPDAAVDALKCKSVLSIAIKAPISSLQKDHKKASEAANILDSDFVIGVWASASRPKMRVLNGDGTETHSGDYVQVSRLGMPLTNEVVIPIGQKDYWNSQLPYNETSFEKYLVNPELALYMDDDQFGPAVPGFAPLRIQRNSLGMFDFGNGKDGLAGLLGNPATKGTALDQALFGNFLLRKGQPRSVDLLPIFHTGVPNLAPYQLAVGKRGNPLAVGKPFINNFLPTFGDMLRLNMAVPTTKRTDPKFSSLGLLQAAVLGLTDSAYNTTANLQFIPNMDGFPNGRRLEDDVTRIELQAVSGIVLSVLGLWYDDFTVGGNPVTPNLLNVLTFTTGVEANDKPFRTTFPFMQPSVSGFDLENCQSSTTQSSLRGAVQGMDNTMKMDLGAPRLMMQTYPNPAVDRTTFKYRVGASTKVTLRVYDQSGTLVQTLVNGETKQAGSHEVVLNLARYKKGTYYVTIADENQTVQSLKLQVSK
ncbi:MAG: DUF4331 family protein [Ferruginibacter sp.]|nr:DUF4331 family protein [Cytophagales bacterium]